MGVICIGNGCHLLELVLDFMDSRVALMSSLKSCFYTFAVFTSLSARDEQNVLML